MSDQSDSSIQMLLIACERFFEEEMSDQAFAEDQDHNFQNYDSIPISTITLELAKRITNEVQGEEKVKKLSKVAASILDKLFAEPGFGPVTQPVSLAVRP